MDRSYSTSAQTTPTTRLGCMHIGPMAGCFHHPNMPYWSAQFVVGFLSMLGRMDRGSFPRSHASSMLPM